MSWLSEAWGYAEREYKKTGWGEHWEGEWKKNVEFPWKSGFKAGSSNFGDVGGILGGTIRVETDWYFQNTGPYKDDNPAWSDAPGADDYLNPEQYKDKYGHYKGEAPAAGDADTEIDTDTDTDANTDVDTDSTGGDTDTPAASAALAALMRRRLKMRRGRSATVLTKGAKIGKGDKKQMAYA